ncbi:MAG: hypothetical protein OEZ43_07905 [Gammaproteobacteria bacterium]|nr:hypothetical protein [Gammaproteobacteria bacterium]
MTTDNAFTFTLDYENPFAFIDANLIALAQVEDVYQLNEVLGAFLAEDVQNFLADHHALLFILSQVWNEAVQRTVLEVDDIIFPDGLLMIPPIFSALGWLEDSDKWEELHQTLGERFQNDNCLTYALALLFVEAMRGDMATSVEHFVEHTGQLSEDDALHAERYLENLKYFGWPVSANVANPEV